MKTSTLVTAAAILFPLMLQAESVVQMNLREMFQRSDKIFSGIVLSATPGTVVAGGGELPTVTYRIIIEDSFQGDFEEIKGVRFVELRMLAIQNLRVAGASVTGTYSPALPEITVGQEYLLLTTRPSAIGMSCPVGLGQGCFRIKGKGSAKVAVNDHDNSMLFRGMSPPGPRQRGREDTHGPIKYSDLSEQIRNLVKEKRTKR